MQSFCIRAQGAPGEPPHERDASVVYPMPITEENRSKKGRASRVNPASDYLLNMNQLGHRWSRTPVAARQRLEQHGVPLVRFSRSSCEVWLSDVVALEARFSSHPKP
jgi:hypothetical protein